MNFFSLNGASINGSSASKLVLATALLSCGVTLKAEIYKLISVDGHVVASANVTANSTVIRNPGIINIEAQAYLTGLPKLTHASKAAFNGSASIVAYTLRRVDAEIAFTGGAELEVVVASSQGKVQCLGSATVSPVATRIQSAYIANDFANESYIIAISEVKRFAETALSVKGNVRAEAAINYHIDGYADTTTDCNILAIAECKKNASSLLTGLAESSAIATVSQYAQSVTESNGFLFSVEPNVVAIPFVQAKGDAKVLATGFIIKEAGSVVNATCNWLVLLKQVHSVEASVNSEVSIASKAFITSKSNVNFSTEARVSSVALRIVAPLAVCTTDVKISADTNIHWQAKSDYLCGASVSCNADPVNFRLKAGVASAFTNSSVICTSNQRHAVKSTLAGSANAVCFSEDLNTRKKSVTAVLHASFNIKAVASQMYSASSEVARQCELQANPITTVRYIYSEIVIAGAEITLEEPNITSDCKSNVTGTVGINAVGSKIVLISANECVKLGGSVLVYADTITNPEAKDPVSRMFYKLPVNTTFFKPAIKTDFERT